MRQAPRAWSSPTAADSGGRATITRNATQRTGTFSPPPHQQARLLGLEKVAANFEKRGEHREGPEADRVAHGEREELRNVRQVHADRGDGVEDSLKNEGAADEGGAHYKLV